MISKNPNADLILKEDPQYSNLTYIKASSEYDKCCRDKQPQPSAPRTPVIPEFYKENFNNGLKTIFSQTNEVPKVYIRLKINGGSLLENPKKVPSFGKTDRAVAVEQLPRVLALLLVVSDLLASANWR